MQFSWHIIIASVSAFLFQSAANLAEAGNNRLTTYEPRPFLLAQARRAASPRRRRSSTSRRSHWVRPSRHLPIKRTIASWFPRR